MRRGRWFAGLFSMVALTFLSGSCAPPLSELFIGAATDLSAPDVLDRVVLSARREGVEVVHNEWDITGIPGMPYQLPGSFNVYTNDGSEPRVEIVLSGYRGEQEIVRRRALLTLVRGERKFLRMALVNRCMNNLDCPGGRTCVEGRCVPAEVNARLLPTYQPGMEETMSCNSGTVLINTSTGQPMAMAGSGACGEGERCGEGTCVREEPSCRDGVRNGDETDVDCGGSCAGCGGGTQCGVDGDCAVGVCMNGTCSTTGVCGDGNTDASVGERCDDSNVVTENACPYGMPTCTRCNADCSAALNLTGPYCGDGSRNGPETCDDGDTVTETACPYGQATCTRCRGDCSAALNLTGPYCGDDSRNGPETCDDGDTVTETACPYGQATCTRCNADCTATLNLSGPFCGDGVLNGPEACDDGNNLACGTCDTTCSTSQDDAASGSITAVSVYGIIDGVTLTLNDGVNPATIFEFDRSGDGASAGRTPISLSGVCSASDVAFAISAAINGVGVTLLITATAFNDLVSLTNDQRGSFGNQPILTDSGLMVNDMAGGGGYDCPASTGCATNADCASGLTCRGTGPKTCQ